MATKRMFWRIETVMYYDIYLHHTLKMTLGFARVRKKDEVKCYAASSLPTETNRNTPWQLERAELIWVLISLSEDKKTTKIELNTQVSIKVFKKTSYKKLLNSEKYCT